MGLTVLITNASMDWPSGAVVYTRDLALELQRQGHRPIVYTWIKGRTGRELSAAGIEIVDRLWKVGTRPDVIHGHHRPLVRGALLRYPDVPAVILCHNPTDLSSTPAPDPRIRRYVGVSELCMARLLEMGAPAARTCVRPNFVDLARFTARPPLPPRPSRALVFSNYAAAGTHLPVIQEACRRLDIPLDVLGRGVGRISDHPEQLLPEYDLVFAVGKAALEAMAVGAAVVLCDRPGLGPMVKAADFERLRSTNFGLASLVEPLSPEGILEQIERYDPADAGLVRDLVRTRCGLETATRGFVDAYRQVIEEAAASPAAVGRSLRRSVAARRYRATEAAMVAFYGAFGLGPRRIPAPLKPPYRLIRRLVRRSVGV